MNMIATVVTKERAWQLADKLFPTDYSRNEPDSLRAGYPIFNTTSTDSKYKGLRMTLTQQVSVPAFCSYRTALFSMNCVAKFRQKHGKNFMRAYYT